MIQAGKKGISGKASRPESAGGAQGKSGAAVGSAELSAGERAGVCGRENVRYEMSKRVRAIGFGGIGAIHTMVQALGLDAVINDALHLCGAKTWPSSTIVRRSARRPTAWWWCARISRRDSEIAIRLTTRPAGSPLLPDKKPRAPSKPTRP